MIDFFIPTPEVPPEIVRPSLPDLPGRAFPAASLGKWLEIAHKANVPIVPAESVAKLRIDDLIHFEKYDDPDVVKTIAVLDNLNNTLEEGQMLRWDCCAGFEVKIGMSEGQKPQGQGLHLVVGEPRTFDLLFEFPAENIDIWRRPWVKAEEIDGFPIEFRVFIANNQIVGVANYYLQRGLPADEKVLDAVNESLKLSQRMLNIMLEEGQISAMPGIEAEDLLQAGIHCSLDFLLTPDGQTLFLEGGPGYGFGAHPCAFYDEKNNIVDPIEGIKLESGLPAIPLPNTPPIYRRKASP